MICFSKKTAKIIPKNEVLKKIEIAELIEDGRKGTKIKTMAKKKPANPKKEGAKNKVKVQSKLQKSSYRKSKAKFRKS